MEIMEDNVMIISGRGTHTVCIDNTGAMDVGDVINDIIQNHCDDTGLDLFFSPGIYLIETPIIIDKSNISLQGYCFGFRHPQIPLEGKSTFLVGKSCTDAIEIRPAEKVLIGFTIRNMTVSGQNGKLGVRPDITPTQNGIRIMDNTPNGACVVDYCQFVHLSCALICEAPKSSMDVWYVTDNWISECNYAIWLDTALYASVFSRNGFHDMTETVLHIDSSGANTRSTKEMVITENTCWNTGKLAFDIDSFNGGTISHNTFTFNNQNCQAFARLRRVHKSNIIANTWVEDVDPAPGAAQGKIGDGEIISTLTLENCRDNIISQNQLTSVGKNRSTIYVGGKSEKNHITMNKCLTTDGEETSRHIELAEETANNLVLLPTTSTRVNSSVAIDRGKNNEFAGLPAIEVV